LPYSWSIARLRST